MVSVWFFILTPDLLCPQNTCSRWGGTLKKTRPFVKKLIKSIKNMQLWKKVRFGHYRFKIKKL